MLSDKQMTLAKSAPKDFLNQYKPICLLAQVSLERAEWWSGRNEEFCAELAREARERMTLASDIAELIEAADISDQYKSLLRLRFIKGLTVLSVMTELGFTSKRWTDTLQSRALKAFAQAVEKEVRYARSIGENAHYAPVGSATAE